MDTTLKPRKTELRDGMRIDWDAPIPMDDGVVLRADVFRPDDAGKHPVILSYGAFGKGLAFQDGNRNAWERMIAAFPEVAAGSSNLYQSWEVVDPEKWVPDGYVCIRVDCARRRPLAGIPRSVVAARGARHLRLHRVGRRAAVEQRQGRHERHLLFRHEPVVRGFAETAAPRRHLRVGRRGRPLPRRHPARRHLLPVHGQPVPARVHAGAARAGRARLAQPRDRRAGVRPRDAVRRGAPAQPDRLRGARARASVRRCGASRALAGVGEHRHSAAQRRQLGRCQGLHPRGNFEGFLEAASTQKWLEAHGDAHWSHFYTDYGVGLQKRFFGHFLKGEDTGWSRQPQGAAADPPSG